MKLLCISALENFSPLALHPINEGRVLPLTLLGSTRLRVLGDLLLRDDRGGGPAQEVAVDGAMWL